MTQQYDNKGQVALWRNEKTNDKAPDFKGHFFAHRDIKAGEKIDAALWNNLTDNDKAPVLKGKTQDVFSKDDGISPVAPAQLNDSIPF
jgi:hypothetical protein|tara:strand:- start:49 stop:312 length:264 start_codon:yes stop_codon:yes gene_type:complete